MRLIDADALPHYDGTALSAVEVARAVIHAPTIEERKKGKWIEIKRNDVNPLTGRRGVYVGCSECGCPIPTDSQLDYIDESEALFCYQCGADMREEKDNAKIH